MSATLEVSGFCKIKSKRILRKPGTRAGDVIFCSNILLILNPYECVLGLKN